MNAIISGATSGIGRATAKLFAEQNINLVLIGRREKRLRLLQKELSSKVFVHTISLDLREKNATLNILNDLPIEFKTIDILVNNAGNAHGLSPIQDGDVTDWDLMIDTNIKGFLYLSKPIITFMKKQQFGHVVNIGSIAGKEVYPNGNVYCATKHAVDAISQAMRIDLNGTGVKVSQICPGLVETEFSEVRFKGDKQRAKEVYKGVEALQAEDIAELIYFIVTRPKHVNLADCLVLPTNQANATIVHRKLI